MKNLLLLIITASLISCSPKEPDTITVQGTIIAEDDLKLSTGAKLLTDLRECHTYLIETDSAVYMAMTPSISADPLDSAFTGTFVLSKVVQVGNSSEYVGGKIKSTKMEFRNLISYK